MTSAKNTTVTNIVVGIAKNMISILIKNMNVFIVLITTIGIYSIKNIIEDDIMLVLGLMTNILYTGESPESAKQYVKHAAETTLI